MHRDDVMRWVDGYEQAWRDADADGLDQLFVHDAVYRSSPYEEPMVGLEAIRDFWIDDEDDVFSMSASLVAVDGPNAVVRVEVGYGEPVHQEFRDLWVLRFADDGRVADFEEWAYWPGLPYAPGDSPD
jgi:hypothetical protein